MRQVDRVRVQVWLKFLSLAGGVSTEPIPNEALTLHEALHLISGRYGRLCLIWQEPDQSFRLQVIPKRLNDGRLTGPVGMSYAGHKLLRLLCTAAMDLRLLHDGHLDWEGSSREVVRWVE